MSNPPRVTTAKPRLEEVWAQRAIGLHLRRRVEMHDDNSAAGMYDLRVGPADAPEIAIEVTGAIDAPYTETWIAGRRWSGKIAGVVGDWTVLLKPGAHAKSMRADLPLLLTAITSTGRDELAETDVYREPELCGLLRRLSIQHVHRSNPDGPGKVWFILDGDGGFVDSGGRTVPGWVGEFLAAEERADVLRKLSTTTAPRREVFVLVDLKGAPWGVVSYLTDISRRGLSPPSDTPQLPDPVTGVWLASTLTFSDDPVGVHWDGAEWSSFRSRGDGIDGDDN